VDPTAVVPIRSFEGLSRLADALPADRRSTVMLRLALRTTETLRDAGTTVVVVSGDPAVRAWASNQHLRVVDEPDPPGLDAAAAAGIDTTKGPWLVVHADLPLISGDDVGAALAALDSHGHVVAPSHDGGTSLIGGKWPIFEFAYGPGSFRRHLARVPTAKVLVRHGLALDLDRVRDLDTLRGLRTP
jgi:2-phospho-L-lactate guanylyltransferase